MVAKHLLVWSHHVVWMMTEVLHLSVCVWNVRCARWVWSVSPVRVIGHRMVLTQPRRGMGAHHALGHDMSLAWHVHGSHRLWRKLGAEI